MSCWPDALLEPGSLRGSQGELVFIRVRVDSRLIEDLLEALATADFPINPEIRHAQPATTVEFPAYDTQVPEVRRLIESVGIGPEDVELANMLRAIA